MDFSKKFKKTDSKCLSHAHDTCCSSENRWLKPQVIINATLNCCEFHIVWNYTKITVWLPTSFHTQELLCHLNHITEQNL